MVGEGLRNRSGGREARQRCAAARRRSRRRLAARCSLLQVHLAFAGPGAYAVTWVTYPLDSPRLEGSGERQVVAAAGATRRLAAAPASQQQQLTAAALDASSKVERRRRDRCGPVVQAGGKSVVQYGTESGDYQHTGACSSSPLVSAAEAG